MKKTVIMFIIAALAAYMIDWCVRRVKSVVQYRRIQRRIDKAMEFMATDECQAEIERQAQKVVDSLDL